MRPQQSHNLLVLAVASHSYHKKHFLVKLLFRSADNVPSFISSSVSDKNRLLHPIPVDALAFPAHTSETATFQGVGGVEVLAAFGLL